jgi:hypothetical protein
MEPEDQHEDFADEGATLEFSVSLTMWRGAEPPCADDLLQLLTARAAVGWQRDVLSATVVAT